MAHDAIFEAAVVAVPHPQWQERPVACVVQKKNSTVTKKKYMRFKTAVCKVVVARRDCIYGRNTENICWEVLKQALRKELEHLRKGNNGIHICKPIMKIS